MLAMYGRLRSLRKKQRFLINVNLLNNFITPLQDKYLFGYKIAKTHMHYYDLSNIDNVLDISLFRNTSVDKAYLVISGNLKDAFRRQLAQSIWHMICEATETTQID